MVVSRVVQTSLFDEINRIEIRIAAYPTGWLMVCRNPLLDRRRAAEREDMLSKSEDLLDPIMAGIHGDCRSLGGGGPHCVLHRQARQ